MSWNVAICARPNKREIISLALAVPRGILLAFEIKFRAINTLLVRRVTRTDTVFNLYQTGPDRTGPVKPSQARARPTSNDSDYKSNFTVSCVLR